MKNNARAEVKRILKESIPESELVQIFVSMAKITSIHWTKEGKEFRFMDQMYDVVKSVSKSDGVLFYCLHDAKESKLFENLDSFIESHVADNPKNQKNAKRLMGFSIKDFFYPEKLEFNISENTFNRNFIQPENKYISPFLYLDTPPPKKFSFRS
ncbi:MAG: hypothetical protein K9H64_12495 [Bacteroidales bacterium]|nr:hypothetical protein [Bacteroidales bacterium]MCF8456864.1 hypothetical protein [Bacteroidales bacterium]